MAAVEPAPRGLICVHVSTPVAQRRAASTATRYDDGQTSPSGFRRGADRRSSRRSSIEEARAMDPWIGPWPALAVCLHALAAYLYSASWASWASCFADFLELAA